MSTDKITFLLNWQPTPYHIPIFLAQTKGYFKEQGLDIAILEPTNPSDVTELIGSGKVDMGLKAMIHTLAAKARGFPVTSVASLLDEPFTGVLYLKGSGITEDFQSLKEEDRLRMKPEDYTAVRCGMNVAKYIIEGKIDAGIGIECMQQVELEEYLAKQGRPASDAKKSDPVKAWKEYIDFKPQLNNDLSYKQYQRCYAYFSSSLYNVHRDWKKVTGYGKRLAILPPDYVSNYTNEYLSWPEPEEVSDPLEAQRLMAIHQEKCRQEGTFKRLALPA
ncbi:BBF_HP2_G0006570.mRNA.1.CDS.1 [Saccharomyces cerevisiae]|nr:BBF_HP2_G0006570.mRNA.1.CDS.1 [Saccharomyces cerevisiae]CAI6415973.1 BBF_HP2_G0006570.mRNA.1.CDS.1 [Saccharomyces cerevisiae]